MIKYNGLPSNQPTGIDSNDGSIIKLPYYSATTLLITAECLKCLTCIIALYFIHDCNVSNAIKHVKNGSPKYLVLVSIIPSIGYFIQNLLQNYAASNLPSGVYQVTSQSKLISTAFFAILLLNRSLSKTKWFFIFTLFCGVSLIQLKPSTNEDITDDFSNQTMGLIAAIATASISGFNGIFIEKLMKKVPNEMGIPSSMWLTNLHLSSWSILFGIMTAYQKDFDNYKEYGIFHGFTKGVWSLTFIAALGGILVALVIRHLDNMLKNFAVSLAVIFTTMMGQIWFNEKIPPFFWPGAMLVVGSVYGYNQKSDFVEEFLLRYNLSYRLTTKSKISELELQPNAA